MKLGKKIWLLVAAAAVIIVVVVLAILLSSTSGPGGTPTPTATGIGYPTPTATGSVGPTTAGTCRIYFDKTSCTIKEGETFNVTVMISNVNYLVTGQFDVVYDNSSLNIAKRPTNGQVNDIYRSCGNISVSNEGDGVGGDYTNSGLFRVIVEVLWSQDTQDPCDGGAGTGPCGDGYLATFTFRGMKPGTSEIAFTGTKQVNQIVDWVPYEDYSYSGGDVVWGPNVEVTVQ
jgi:hypothetical protein